MKKDHLQHFSIPKKSKITLKEMGNIKEICYQDKINTSCYIRKLNENEYIYLPTGEIMTCRHIQNRSENLQQVSQTLKRLREYINTNVVNPTFCKWITLTYAENMTDKKRLYADFQKFMQKLKYNFKEFKLEYIVAMEPQGRGAWHAHLILIFDKKAPYIPNKLIQQLWKQGFTKTQKLNDIDNVGAYLTAYLGDIEIQEELASVIPDNKIKVVTEIDGKKLDKPKKILKGGRLFLYPPKFNIYRISRGIKKPTKTFVDYAEARKKIGSFEPTYFSALTLTDINSNGDTTFTKTIAYEYYNIKRLEAQH